MKTFWWTCLSIALLGPSVALPAQGQEDIAPETAALDPIYHDCVVIILDASGSMDEPMGATGKPKMAAAKSALTRVLATVPPATYVGILVFSGRGVANPWVRPLGPRPDDDELARAIAPIQPAGRTPLGQFIKRGADRLLAERARQFGYGSYRLLVVTDGQASDAQLVAAYTPDVLSRGITLDVVGVDMARDHMLATKAHSYRRADDPASLERAVAQVFAEVTAASQDTGVVGDSAFELTAAIPPELALKMISALVSSGNQPIGKSPTPTPAEQPHAKAPRPKPTATPSAPAQPSPPSPQPDDDSVPLGKIIIYGAVALAIYLVWRAKKRGRS